MPPSVIAFISKKEIQQVTGKLIHNYYSVEFLFLTKNPLNHSCIARILKTFGRLNNNKNYFSDHLMKIRTNQGYFFELSILKY